LIASGENRAIEAARKAIHSKLLEVSIDGATDAIVNITSGTNITLLKPNKHYLKLEMRPIVISISSMEQQ
jgi:cell division GTPase FtsZ